MYILGLGGSLHDFSACLVQDNKIVVAIEDERISRVKHSAQIENLQNAIENNQVWKYTSSNQSSETIKCSVQYCLDYAGISIRDIDYIVTTDSNLWVPYVQTLDNLVVINHHTAHAASTFFTSPYKNSAILVVDGKGSNVRVGAHLGEETLTIALGDRSKIVTVEKRIEHSLGHFYSAVTRGLGFRLLEDGKTMGLSSYGDDRFLPMFREFFDLQYGGDFRFTCSMGMIKDKVETILKQSEQKTYFQTRADLAYAAQHSLETIICHICTYIAKQYDQENICLAGGVALNSVANGKLVTEGIFRNIHIFPACGDNGLSVGCALYGAYALSNFSREEVTCNAGI